MASRLPRLAADLAPLVSRILSAVDDRKVGDAVVRAIAWRAPDERLALAFVLKLADETPAEFAQIASNRNAIGDLAFCLGASELVASHLSAIGRGWAAEFKRARAADAASLARDTTFTPSREALSSRANAAAELAKFKRLIFSRILIADLLGSLSVEQTAAAMSDLADECISAACTMASALMGERARAAHPFCVLAMGKLGARELNLSSDIDLIYINDPADAVVAPEAAAHMGELVTELLTPGCFRVDLRLRPGGRSSPLVVPIAGALGFYQSMGRTWERAALLRARAVAGDIGLGERLVSDLQSFIYRRYLDFDTLGDLRTMKMQIEAELSSPAMVDRNIKLGRGGIRELEFIVQSLTLIYGGRDARIRCLGTFDALSRLALHGYLPHETSRRLADAYRFLRDVEHKLQAVAGLQTHSIPAQPAAIRALAARLKLGKDDESIARLNFRLGECRALIARQFRETLAGGGDSLQLSSEAANQAWRAAENPEASAPILARMGFANGQASARALAGLASGHFGSAASPPRRSEILTRLGPILIDEISRLPDPDLAIVHLNDFMAAVGARSSFLALLEQHPATRRILLRLFASSAYLSTIFIRHPDMLDTLVRSDIARAQRAGFEMARELDELMAASPDFESRLDALRAFRHQEFLRIAIGDLAGSLDIREVENELTVLAETVLRAALTVARDEVAVRYPDAAAPAMAVIAMGRLGAAEMSYNSDLDLIFIHDDAAEAAGAAREVAWRIAQKLIAVLESRTREGYAYKLDLRLRPSGNAGPLVTSLGGFREYHRLSSAVWERQALVRARVVAGDDALARAVENARVEFVFGRAITAAEVAEIRAMRMRMEREIGVENRTRINLKQGRGGLVDVEFVAQMIALRHGYSDAAMRERNTTAMLQAMAANPAWRESALALEDDYLFLTRLENRLRIESDQASWALPTAPELIHPLARRMGYEGAQAPHRMLAELADRRDRIRAAFDRFFSSEERTEP